MWAITRLGLHADPAQTTCFVLFQSEFESMGSHLTAGFEAGKVCSNSTKTDFFVLLLLYVAVRALAC